MELKTKQIRKPADPKIESIIGLRPGETYREFIEKAKTDKRLISALLPSQYGNGLIYAALERQNIDFDLLNYTNSTVISALDEYSAKSEALLDMCGLNVSYHGHNEWRMHKVSEIDFCRYIGDTIRCFVSDDEPDIDKIKHTTRILRTIEQSIDYNKCESPKRQVQRWLDGHNSNVS